MSSVPNVWLYLTVVCPVYDCLKTKIYPLELDCAENISRSRRAGSMPVMSKGWSKKSLRIFYLIKFSCKIWSRAKTEIWCVNVEIKYSVTASWYFGPDLPSLSCAGIIKSIMLPRPPTWSWHLKLYWRICKFWVRAYLARWPCINCTYLYLFF